MSAVLLSPTEAEALVAEAAAEEAVEEWRDLLAAAVAETAALEAAGVPAVLVGGVATALTTGRASSGVPPVAVEVLVPVDAVHAAADVLAGRGWGLFGGLALDDLLVARHRASYEAVVLDPDRSRPELVLYWHLLPDHLDAAVDADRVARATRRVVSAPDGPPVEVRVAAAADLLVALAVIEAAAPEPSVDAGPAAAALLASGEVDAGLVVAAARRGRVGWMVAAFLDGLPEDVRTLLPEPVREQLHGDRPHGAGGWYARHRIAPTWGALDPPARFVARHLGIVARGRPLGSLRSVPAHARVARAAEVGPTHQSSSPMNGQVGRRLLVRRLAAALPVEAGFETGTHRGHTTPFLARVFGCDIWTAEVEPTSAASARGRFSRSPAIHPVEGDSPTVLAGLTDHFGPGRTFFYLDAHWRAQLPLWDELAVVFAYAPDPVVMIDDFAVPDDPGYAYDAYGPGQVLDLEHLAPHVPAGYSCWFPTLPAAAETGTPRGCVVIARDEHAGALEGCLLGR